MTFHGLLRVAPQARIHFGPGLRRPPGQQARPAAENAALTHQPQTDKIPSSAAFDAIAAALTDDADRKDAVKKGGAVFAFTIKNKGGETESWYIDLKKTGTVGKGAAPEGGKSDGEFRNVRVVRASTRIHRHASISRSPRALGIMVSASASAPPATVGRRLNRGKNKTPGRFGVESGDEARRFCESGPRR